MNKKLLKQVTLFFLVLFTISGAASATMNVVVITDPTGQDPNGAAAGSQSFAQNMFQPTFLLCLDRKMAVLSGGEGTAKPRLAAIVSTVSKLENNATPAEAAAEALKYNGIRILVASIDQGSAVAGDFQVYIVTVGNDSSIDVKGYSGGVAELPPGTKGAIIHLRNSEGNPQAGTADTVRLETAVKMGKMIRDGYPATIILGEAFKEVAIDSGEKHGGGGVNLVSGISTGDMFTPLALNQNGYNMDAPYSKQGTNGWSVGYPEANNYQADPTTGGKLTVVYAYEALTNTITVTDNNPSVSTHGSDQKGLSEATSNVVDAAITKSGYDPVEISKYVNSAIDSGLLVGVNHVSASDINVKENIKSVGVYYTPTTDGKSAPSWDLPIDSQIFELLGNIQTAIGFMLIMLALFRSTLIKSFFRRRKT
ncbi:MAG: hypothetical protein Q4Q23_00245 [Methanobacteriaceae archaeon]|nr:hypothetical protein [Methanobacteriaceae archaeon]